jgi:hypothetical protein
MDSNTDQECGEGRKEIATKENGNLENLKVMAFILLPTEIPMKVSSRNV